MIGYNKYIGFYIGIYIKTYTNGGLFIRREKNGEKALDAVMIVSSVFYRGTMIKTYYNYLCKEAKNGSFKRSGYCEDQ